MLEWLKTILGENYSEEIDTAVSGEIGKNFVSKSNYDQRNTAYKDLQKQIAERDTQLEELKKVDATKLDGESRAFIEAWRDYKNSMDMGYEHLDCENSPSNVTEYAEALKENGIKKFTFSSTWSGAVEDAWKFQSAGYRIEGVTKAPKTAFVFTAE